MSANAQTPSAFTGHLMHAQPFSDAQAFRTPLYSKWCVARRNEPKETPDWPEFQAQASKPKTLAKSNPAPGQLSKRGQKLVEWQDYGPGKSSRAKAARTGAPA